ncbi:MAG: metal ABC transporter permease [Cytophagales bacterium]|nr:metal ABC transporter permease [Cytophagales bacterium]
MPEIFQYDYAVRALIAASIVGITSGILGSFVILRRIALIGDALSHAILPGVVAGFILFGHHPLAIFCGAVVAGLITSVIITWVQRNSITKDDASIGIVFTAMFALGIIGISWVTKREGVHLDMKDFLFGNVLGVSDSDLVLTGMIGLYVIVSVAAFYKYFFISTFDPVIAITMGISVAVIHYFLMFLLSLSIVASLQSVGVILVVAMLIIPSSTAYLLTNKFMHMLIISALVGMMSAVVGFLAAVWLEITPGPTITLAASFFFVLALFFSPRRGILLVSVSKMSRSYIADQQDILKLIQKISEDLNIEVSDVIKYTALDKKWVWVHLYHLALKKQIKILKNRVILTSEGKHQAQVLLRAHRVWESYLVNRMNVPIDQIHGTAEALEHVLPSHFIDKVEQDLGYPAHDPHGSPIPKIKKRTKKLGTLKVGDKGYILEEQTSGLKELWQLGIFPNSEFVIKQIENDSITIQIKNAIFVLNKQDADKIKVNV